MPNGNLHVPFGEWEEADNKTPALLPEGEHVLRIVSVEETKIKQGPNEGTPGLVVWFQPVSGPYSELFVVDRFYTMKSTLWRFAGFLRAAGLKVTQNDMTLPYNKLVGKVVTATLVDGDEFKGARKSEVSGYAPAIKTDPMQGSGLTEETELVGTPVAPERADAILGGIKDGNPSSGFDVEDPWALDNEISL